MPRFTAGGRKPGQLRPISRFIVMAVLQAARARRLGLSDPSAYSWGLNRAIFYAAAKRGFGGRSGSGGDPGSPETPSPDTYYLGDEKAYTSPLEGRLYFIIGESRQTEKEFEKQIIARFGTDERFQKVWSEAMELVAGFDEAVLKSGKQFYSQVYKPRRDELAQLWTERLAS